MKRIAAVAVALSALSAGTAHAQSYATDRGSTLLGGGASWTTNHVQQNIDGDQITTDITNVQISPAVQYFVRPGLAVGGVATFSHASHDIGTSYGAGPAVSYYFGHGERPYYPYLSADALYLHAPNQHNIAFGGSAGAVFMLSRSVGLDTSLHYQDVRVTLAHDSDPVVKSRSFGLAVGFTAFAFGHRPGK